MHAPISPPKQPVYQRPKSYVRPQPDPNEIAHASKANELLNLRSKNINHIIGQRAEAASAYTPIQLPPKNPRVDELHKELGIDKVVLVTSPFQIDTTPGGFWPNPLLPDHLHSQNLSDGGQGKLRDSWSPGFREAHDEALRKANVRSDALEFSANGNAASACVQGRLLRGGWAVN